MWQPVICATLNFTFLQSDTTYAGIFLLSAAIAIIGLCLVLLGFVFWLIEKTSSRVDLFLRASVYELVLRRARTGDLKWIYDFGLEYFGYNISPVELMHALYKKNGEIFWVIVKRKISEGATTEVNTGYFSILPLNKRAAFLVEKGQLDGRSITTQDLARQHGRPRAIYIGAIAARTVRARGFALTAIQQHIDREKYSQVQKLYAKAVTGDGLRLLTKYGFRSTTGSASGKIGDIFALDK